jgi:hypothetical protein
MASRLDLALQKYPDHEEGIRLLASRDPSLDGKLKYLDWGAKVLASGQALAPEVADVLDLYHRFAGRRIDRRPAHVGGAGERVHPDIYTYQPQDLAKLRDLLGKVKRATDRKRRKRERLYRIEGPVEADVVYDGEDLIVRHIKNKQASVHYGHNTKWCISMVRDGYFEDYETHNSTFFFFERKTPRGDEYDKVALLLPRLGGDYEASRLGSSQAFTSLDRPVDMMVLARVHGTRIFDIFRQVYECSERYPGSAAFQVYTGIANEEQIAAVLVTLASGELDPYETSMLIEAICCNDATPLPALEKLGENAYDFLISAYKNLRARMPRRYRHRHQPRRSKERAKALACAVLAALFVHPKIPADVRERVAKELRRRRIDTDAIHRVKEGGRIGIEWEPPTERGQKRHYRRHRRPSTVKAMRKRAAAFDRAAKTMRKRARTLQRKLTEKKRKKRAAAKRAAKARRAH